MPVVTGLTKERMLQIEAASVVSGDIVNDNLVLKTRGGSIINAGGVRGPQGIKGDPGASGFNSTELGVVDLDTIVNPGLYSQAATAEAISGVNYPVPLAGILEVIASASRNMVWQTYTTYKTPSASTSGLIYVRAYYQSAWGIWRLLGPTDVGSGVDAEGNAFGYAFARPVAGVISVTPPVRYLTVDTEGSIATQAITQINGGARGQQVTVNTTANARDITIAQSVGNIRLLNSVALTSAASSITIRFVAGTWYEVSRAIYPDA